MPSSAGSLSTAMSHTHKKKEEKSVDCAAVGALYFANGMVFTQDILDREDVVKYHNGSPTVNARATYGPAIVQMLAPKPAKTLHDYAEYISTSCMFRRCWSL